MSIADQGTPSFLEAGKGLRLAYRYHPGAPPTLVFLCGLASNMNGNKAMFLESYCRARGQAYLRFDYQGHGASSGEFLDAGIGMWRDDALAVIRQASHGPLILVGSSLGAWIMLLVARQADLQIAALVGIAAAADFTEDLLWLKMSAEEQSQLVATGVLERPSSYAGGPWYIGLTMIEDGRRHLQLRQAIALHCPVRLLHGLADEDVPWQTSLRLMERLESTDVRLTLIKHGCHRLSSERDLAILADCLDELLELVSAQLFRCEP